MISGDVLTLKNASLIFLTIQNTFLAVFMRMATEQGLYLRTVAVMMDELLKLVVCIGILFFFYLRNRSSEIGYEPLDHPDSETFSRGFISGWFRFFEMEVFGSVKVFLAMGIPAVCYTIQKNLLFVAITDLSPAVFQILFQGKILTTALLSYLVLGKEFSRRQKVAMLILFVGCSLVQLSTMSPQANEKSGTFRFRGLFAILVACMTSGFSAVYLERAIKGLGIEGGEKPHAIWVRNIQLSTFGLISAMVGAFLEDKARIDHGGLLQGFSSVVWATVFTSSFGGLLVALVMKYADNMYKTLATSVAVVLTSILSVMFFGLSISVMFLIGAVLTLYAVHLYSSNPKQITPDPMADARLDELQEFSVKSNR
jgi:UDP-sugar transporter A1/2/3